MSQSKQLQEIFNKINEELKNDYGWNLKKNCVSVKLLISDMSEFPIVNEAYKEYFGL
jgi:hypothetical protein